MANHEQALESEAAEGCWVRTRRIQAGDCVRVEVELLSDDASGVTLRPGLRGAIRLVDDDGDAVVSFPGLDGEDSADRFVLRSHLRSLSVWRPGGDHDDQDSCSSDSDDGADPPGGALADNCDEAGHAVFFRKLYKQPGLLVPWDIGQPQPDFVALQSDRPELFASPMLDVGAGFGESSTWLATSLGLRVMACDVSAEALAEARRRLEAKVKQMGRAAQDVSAEFVESNILDDPPSQVLRAEGPFAAALDSAAFHCIGDEVDQRRYVQALAALVQPHGHLIMLASSERRAAGVDDPRLRRVTRQELRALFCAEAGWEVEEIRESRYCLVAPSMAGRPPQRVSLPAWLMVARRLQN